MLIDNVAELTLHKYVQDLAYDNELWTKLKQPKYNPEEVQKALGQYFDIKVKFAHKYSLIDKPLCESILIYIHFEILLITKDYDTKNSTLVNDFLFH